MCVNDYLIVQTEDIFREDKPNYNSMIYYLFYKYYINIFVKFNL